MKWTLTFEGERGGEGGWYCPAYNHDYECCEHKDSPAKDKPCPGLGNEGCPAVPAPEPSKVEPLREREAVERYRNARENRDRLSYTTTGCSHETKVAYEEREDARKATFAALPPAPEDGK